MDQKKISNNAAKSSAGVHTECFEKLKDGKLWYFAGPMEAQERLQSKALKLFDQHGVSFASLDHLLARQNKRRGAWYFQYVMEHKMEAANIYFFSDDEKFENPGTDQAFHQGKQFKHVWRQLLDKVDPENEIVWIVRIFELKTLSHGTIGQVLTQAAVKQKFQSIRREAIKRRQQVETLVATTLGHEYEFEVKTSFAPKAKEVPIPTQLPNEPLEDFEQRYQRFIWVTSSNGGKETWICAFCCKASSQRLSCCARCKQVTYCDGMCQKKHWKQHKPECKTIVSTA